jgi:hypothetical protein
MPSGERREWIKPIMFSGGIGNLDASHVDKHVSVRDQRMLLWSIRYSRSRSSNALRLKSWHRIYLTQSPEKGMLVVKIGGPAYR